MSTSTVTLKPPEFVETTCSPSAVSPTGTLLALPAATQKWDPASRRPAACTVGPLSQKWFTGKQKRIAPSHSADRLQLSCTAATPLATVVPLLPKVTQFCAGHRRHPLWGHG